ncbi:hypothetical protein [Streptomyces sp. NPDC005890]|uniref:hypothetical protein n=1 Tax=Streptomyces sp. NPDC005890 TaxID=3154568 RepID=UPI0033DBC77F
MNDYTNVRIISTRPPGCETGRHTPPHPGETCEEMDRWIAVRDRILADAVAAAWKHLWSQLGIDPLEGTVFATPAEPVPVIPDKRAVDQALDILRPHLAWDHRYQETS